MKKLEIENLIAIMFVLLIFFWFVYAELIELVIKNFFIKEYYELYAWPPFVISFLSTNLSIYTIAKINRWLRSKTVNNT